MPIPEFDGIYNCLPPHLGDPALPSDLSPFPCTLAELCTRFNTSDTRKTILEGLLNLRAELFSLGIRGAQWLGGSFVEDIESQEGRNPRDIDAVTIAISPDPASLQGVMAKRMDLFDPRETKPKFSVDHYLMSLHWGGRLVMENSKYWYALFSHRRDGRWKGMLLVNLTDTADDDAARRLLGNPRP